MLDGHQPLAEGAAEAFDDCATDGISMSNVSVGSGRRDGTMKAAQRISLDCPHPRRWSSAQSPSPAPPPLRSLQAARDSGARPRLAFP